MIGVSLVLLTAGTALAVIPGDINNDGNVNLMDSLLALQLMTKKTITIPLFKEADINNDKQIGLVEAIYALQVTSGLRQVSSLFQLYPPDWGVEGYTENYNVTGTVKLNSEEAAASGTYELKIGDLALPDPGVDTYSVSASIELVHLFGEITSTGVMWYNSSNDAPLYILILASGTGLATQTKIGTPFNISILPAATQVGDSGTLTSWNFSNGTTQLSNWSLEPSTAGHALLITESATYEGGILTTSVYQEEKINELGERLSINHEVVDYEQNLTITLRGNRTN